ncbi:MAG: hypothetical protein HY323_14365, partial [Betaproteobacteria bacterium]|nr:hypothetical protein [Betaproteobacteria bacterium]
MTDRADEVARETAGALMRFVRRAQGMTHDERAWYIEGVRPIIAAALR